MKDKKYTIKEASEILNLESHTLRYYEDELELKIERNSLGHRYYCDYDLRVFRHIISLKEQGLQLKAIRNAIKGSYDFAGGDDWKEQGETYLQVVSSLDSPPKAGVRIIRDDQIDITDTSNKKVEQFRLMMKDTFIQAINENQEELKAELNYHIKYKIEEDMKEEIQKVESLYEEKDKERYRKLDETMREMQKIRNQVAQLAEEGKAKRSLFGKLFGKKEIKEKDYILEK